jgi:hypothetical protein
MAPLVWRSQNSGKEISWASTANATNAPCGCSYPGDPGVAIVAGAISLQPLAARAAQIVAEPRARPAERLDHRRADRRFAAARFAPKS